MEEDKCVECGRDLGVSLFMCDDCPGKNYKERNFIRVQTADLSNIYETDDSIIGELVSQPTD